MNCFNLLKRSLMLIFVNIKNSIKHTCHHKSPRHKSQAVPKWGKQTCHCFYVVQSHADLIAASEDGVEVKLDSLSVDIHSHNDGQSFQVMKNDIGQHTNRELNHLLQNQLLSYLSLNSSHEQLLLLQSYDHFFDYYVYTAFPTVPSTFSSFHDWNNNLDDITT